jgi:hypothetical protein
MWKKYPRQMLRSRVVSEGVRTVYPNATSGLYVPEEVRDFDKADIPSDTPPTPAPKRARDLKAEAPKEIEAEPKPDVSRGKAEAWVAKFIDSLGETDISGAEELFAKHEATIAKMADEYPDLHERLIAHKPSGPADEPSPEVNDEAEHPAKAKADEILLEIDETIAIIDVNSLMSRHKEDIEAMPEDLAAMVNRAAEAKKKDIKAEQEKAKARGESVA